MRISRQIGWSQESNLIYQILKQLDRLELIWDGCCPPTTTTTTTNLSILLSYSEQDCANACANFSNNSTYYTNAQCSTNLDAGCRLWLDAGHSQDASNGYYSDGVFCYSISDGSGTIDTKSYCFYIGLSMAVANSARFDIPQYVVGGPNTDFTIEWWIKMSNDGNHPRAWSVGSWPSAAHAVSIESGQFYYWINGSIVSATDISGYTYIGEWTHFCIMRQNADIYIFINGVRFAGGFAGSNMIATNGFPLYIGSEGNDSLCNALMSNFRWVMSSAVYDPTGFTPPTTPLTSISGTQLLILQGDSLPLELNDNSGMGNVVVNNSGIYNSDNPFVGYQGSIQFGTI